MINNLFTAGEIAAAVGGELPPGNSADLTVNSVSIDSRKVEKSGLFVPLAGARTNGHEFLKHAAAGGSTVLMIGRSWWSMRGDGLRSQLRQKRVSLVIVDEPLRALQILAAYHMRKFPHVTRIAITGSNGKTTTKEIVGRILSETAVTLINEGNLNSEIGLPLTVFNMTPECRYAVFEMAMNHPGEMDVLADIVRPHAALITNIGTAHIEYLGSVDAIAAEKKKVFKYFSEKEKGFLYEAEPYYKFLSEGIKGEIIPFGQTKTTGYRGSRNLGLDGTSINWEGLQVHFPLFGRHNLINALGAVTLTRYLGADRKAVKKGLEGVEALFARSQVIRGTITVIQDCYNANPDSMKKVLRFFHSLEWNGRKITVLGSMLELGKRSLEAHVEIALFALNPAVDILYFYGKEMYEAAEIVQKRDKLARCYWTDDFNTLLKKITESIRKGDIILLKGSRGTQLERLVDPILKAAA